MIADDLSGRIPGDPSEKLARFHPAAGKRFLNRHGVTGLPWTPPARLGPDAHTLGRVTTNGIVTEVLADGQLTASNVPCAGPAQRHRLRWMKADELWSVVSTTA